MSEDWCALFLFVELLIFSCQTSMLCQWVPSWYWSVTLFKMFFPWAYNKDLIRTWISFISKYSTSGSHLIKSAMSNILTPPSGYHAISKAQCQKPLLLTPENCKVTTSAFFETRENKTHLSLFYIARACVRVGVPEIINQSHSSARLRPRGYASAQKRTSSGFVICVQLKCAGSHRGGGWRRRWRATLLFWPTKAVGLELVRELPVGGKSLPVSHTGSLCGNLGQKQLLQ